MEYSTGEPEPIKGAVVEALRLIQELDPRLSQVADPKIRGARDGTRITYNTPIKKCVDMFKAMGVGGMLPSQIERVAAYALGVAGGTFSDSEVEEVTLAAAKKVLGEKNFSTYLLFYTIRKGKTS